MRLFVAGSGQDFNLTKLFVILWWLGGGALSVSAKAACLGPCALQISLATSERRPEAGASARKEDLRDPAQIGASSSGRVDVSSPMTTS